MASGKDLKRRITSVKSTQQITKAMKMVAAARLRRAQEAIVRARPFAAAIRGVVENLVTGEEVREHHPLLAARTVKKVNVILITSDRGLTGGFNTNLVKRAEALYRSENSKYEQLTFTCIGKKGYEYLRLRKIPVHTYLPDFQKGMTFARVQVEAEKLLESYIKGEFDEIRVIFSEFRSAISQIPTTETLLPIEVDAAKPATATSGPTDFLFEPNQDTILNELLPRYFKTKLYRALLESVASNYGAQMSAMESATKNAGEMIRKLTQEYNRVRQAGITKELLEIVSGAEALK
jgi:F-type H+-transporting ATPase subunit gamma